MRFLDRLEGKLGWLSFPGFLRYYAIFHLAVFALQFIKPGSWMILDFDKQAILSGQVWRLVSFLFSTSGVIGTQPLSILFFIFGMMLMFVISDSLESAWGTFRTSIFYYTGWLSLIGANFLFGGVPLSGLAFYASVFLAFATVFPRFELRLFLVLPVQVWILGVIMAVGIVFSIIQIPLLSVFYSIALLNYLLWCGVPALKGRKMAIATAQRRSAFEAKKSSKDEAFHTCAVCGRTENSDPALEFRIGTDGREYCSDHLPGGE